MSDLNDMAIAKYRGGIAEGYDSKRVKQEKWHKENEIVERWFSQFFLDKNIWPVDATVLDVPMGTGRFIPIYEKFEIGKVFGVDANEAMLKEAEQKVNKDAKGEMFMGVGNVKELPLPNQSVDISVMVRMTRWLEPWECQQALRELQRVSRKNIIFNARVANHPYARPKAMLWAALHPNWCVEAEEEIEPDYIMFRLGRTTNAMD